MSFDVKKGHTSNMGNSIYQNQQNEALPEWVVLAKTEINENLAIKVQTWWAEIITYSPSSSKKNTRSKDTDTVSFEIRSLIRSMINELNSMMYRILTTCEQKERDNAIQLIVKTLETTAKKTSENSEVCETDGPSGEANLICVQNSVREVSEAT